MGRMKAPANVVRIFQRFFGLNLPGEARRHPRMIELARAYARTRSPGKANLALIDHAALICTPRKPLCMSCSVGASAWTIEVSWTVP
jgi:adenine-specific DNA glycosylase